MDFTIASLSPCSCFVSRYKENTRCCNILAEAIDAEGKITAAHVRRKLKSMDLNPPTRRRLNKKQTSGNDLNDDTVPKRKLIKRSKKEDKICHSEEDSDEESGTNEGSSSDDETLTQIME